MRLPYLLLPALVAAFGSAAADEAVVPVQPPPDGPAVKAAVAASPVLEQKTTAVGPRRITLQKIAPVELPLPQQAASLRTADGASRTTPAPSLAGQPAKPFAVLALGVEVFHSEHYSGKVRTRFRWQSADRQRNFEAVSAVDGMWLTDVKRVETATHRYELFLTPEKKDLDQLEARLAATGRIYTAPQMPAIPEGRDFVLTGGEPADDEDLAPLHALHDLIRTSGSALQQAFEQHEQERRDREAWLKTHPPQPKDVVLKYWRIGGDADAAVTPEPEGGGQ